MSLKLRYIIPAASALFLSAVPALVAQEASSGQPLAKEAVLSSLSGKLDTKKTKVNDSVTAKTLLPLHLSDGSTLPSGTKLSGKVTQVQPKSSGTATLAIVFDQMERKGAAPVPVHGLILAIAPLPDSASGGTAANGLPMRGTAAQNAAMTGASAGPGGGESSIPLGSTVDGVTLNPTPAADGSSVLQSSGKDIKLDSGTRLEIGLSAAQ
jgi:hypothetical protein